MRASARSARPNPRAHGDGPPEAEAQQTNQESTSSSSMNTTAPVKTSANTPMLSSPNAFRVWTQYR